MKSSPLSRALLGSRLAHRLGKVERKVDEGAPLSPHKPPNVLICLHPTVLISLHGVTQVEQELPKFKDSELAQEYEIFETLDDCARSTG